MILKVIVTGDDLTGVVEDISKMFNILYLKSRR